MNILRTTKDSTVDGANNFCKRDIRNINCLIYSCVKVTVPDFGDKICVKMTIG